jgi:hypothetical protein
VALVLVAGAPVPVAAEGPHTSDPAARKSRVDRERHRLEDRYDETLAAEADQVAAYQQSRAVAAQLASRLVVLDRDVASAQAELSSATGAAAKALARRDATRTDLRAAQTELTHRRGELRGMAVSGYVWFGERGSVQSLYGQSLTNEQQLLSH